MADLCKRKASRTPDLHPLSTDVQTFSISASFPASNYAETRPQWRVSLGVASEETSSFSEVFHQVLNITQMFAK
jgi:hypothetical protein